MIVVPVSEGRRKLGDFMNQVRYQKSIITFGKHGVPEAMLIGFPEGYEEISMTELNASSPSFAFLNDEPNLYSKKDIKHKYV